jgi:hypothetical protein
MIMSENEGLCHLKSVIDGEYSCEKTDSTQTVVGKEDI